MEELNFKSIYKNHFLELSPKYYFSRAQIQKNLNYFKELGDEFNIDFLLSIKSFPTDIVFNSFNFSSFSFEASNIIEALRIKDTAHKNIWFNPPFPSAEIASLYPNAFYSTNNASYLKSQKDLILRVNTDFLTSKQKSRFGHNEDEIKSFASITRGFHFHFGSEKNQMDDYKRILDYSLKLSKDFNIDLKILNFGGGLHNLDKKNLYDLCFYLKKNTPASIKIFFEPGQAIFKDSGYLGANILDVRPYRDGFSLAVSASKTCHLRWSVPELILPKSNTIDSKIKLYIFGPTCYENDYIGTYEIPESLFYKMYTAGSPIVFKNINSYSVALNKSFNGIPEVTFNLVD